MRAKIIGGAALVGLVVIGCGGGGGGGLAALQYRTSVARLKALNTGLLTYANDWDDMLPTAGTWMDGLEPYVRDSAKFHSPAVEASGYGYALNSAIAGQSLSAFGDRANTVTIFDSTDLSRNATQPISTMPNPPRYLTKNTIGYLDGRVQDEETNGGTTPPDPYEISRTRMKQAALGVLLYSTDYDDMLPRANTWMDAVAPYHVSEYAFHSYSVEKANPANYGFAMNVDLAGVSWTSLESPSTTPMLFDSTVLTRNATASTSTMPSPGRYKGKNVIAHADGSVP